MYWNEIRLGHFLYTMGDVYNQISGAASFIDDYKLCLGRFCDSANLIDRQHFHRNLSIEFNEDRNTNVYLKIPVFFGDMIPLYVHTLPC